VIVREGVNARHLVAGDIPHLVDLVTIDVAFISLRLIFPSLPPFLRRGADLAALVKPQFEAGRDEVGKRGLVLDPAIHAAVIERTSEAAAASGFRRVGMTPSPITGATGNQEFFLHLRYD
jgi:23S rRNA (cytidine1920-2'-O)/16S rRNA (cytidine1409-2'-O)-methyltransferase